MKTVIRKGRKNCLLFKCVFECLIYQNGVIKLGYLYYNPNPAGRQSAGDCTVRALSKALHWDGDWMKTYAALCVAGVQYGDVPSANEVWGNLLLENGYEEHSLLTKCKDCYNLIMFCSDHPKGEYVVCTGQHVIYCKNGSYYDSWDSGDVTPIYYFEKVKEE